MGRLTNGFLHQVVTPARYLGLEFNSVSKDPAQVAVRFALCYPDTYEIGMSHLGSQILYAVMNEREDTYCERAFHPWLDAADLMRREGLPLTSLETQTPLAEFDFIGITLQHELNYTSVLSLLDLAGVPLRTADRAPEAPLVIAGGPCAYNPEPVADFFDLFVIGEGEEVIHEVLGLYASGPYGRTGQRTAGQRQALLEALAGIEGVYVPSLGVGRTVHKRIVADLNSIPPPLRPIVPYCGVTHDRAQMEINRGCTRGCRFCQAGMVYRPVRERSVENLLDAAMQIIDNTGFDELSLVSLNCPDYSEILRLVDRLNEQLASRRVSLGLPSLRTDSFSVELAERVQRVRKSGLTFAPEAGSQAMRDVINKNITEDNILDAARAAFSAGWHRLKLYFMIGLPGETDDDVLQIAELTRKILALGREVLGKQSGRLTLGVSVAAFIPKPHTPFQWTQQQPIAEIERRQSLLWQAFGQIRQAKLATHNAKQALVEGLLARGGRELSGLVEDVYRAGAVFESWSDRFDLGLWEQAGAARGLDIASEAVREWSLDEPLPWDHIDCGVSKAFLQDECRRAQRHESTVDCRYGPCSACGVRDLVGVCPLAGDACGQ